ncbi:hypothetical protein Leryth_014233 [Lithospermum erythrorhizon]|nr:hypothetical protein Leryth_014233 [Lithospermum erythrorhizon]
MGRPPCCDKIGVKKGPWTPEEDIILVSYIQEHGPANWRAVPTTTGLLRCSKSCRLRWANYLRPGIRRGNFTEQEEKMIIHLQALLGNRWAAIASYLLKDTLKLGQWEKRLQTDVHMAKLALNEALSIDKSNNFDHINNLNNITNINTNNFVVQSKPVVPLINQHQPIIQLSTSTTNYTATSTYASSCDNIARLLQSWIKTPPNKSCQTASETTTQSSLNNPSIMLTSSSPSEVTFGEATPEGGFDSLFSNFNTCSMAQQVSTEHGFFNATKPSNLDSQMPLSLLEKWLFDDNATGAVQGMEWTI